MKIRLQNQARLRKLAELVAGIPMATLTALSPEGELESEPVLPLRMDEDGALWFFAHRISAARRPAALNLSFTRTADATCVSVAGLGEPVIDLEAMRSLWRDTLRRWFPDGPGDAELTLLRLCPRSVRYWDAVNGRMVRLLAPATMDAPGPAILGRDGGSARV